MPRSSSAVGTRANFLEGQRPLSSSEVNSSSSLPPAARKSGASYIVGGGFPRLVAPQHRGACSLEYWLACWFGRRFSAPCCSATSGGLLAGVLVGLLVGSAVFRASLLRNIGGLARWSIGWLVGWVGGFPRLVAPQHRGACSLEYWLACWLGRRFSAPRCSATSG